MENRYFIIGPLNYQPTVDDETIIEEIDQLLKDHFPNVSRETFNENAGTNTVFKIKKEVISFPIDVMVAISASLATYLNY